MTIKTGDRLPEATLLTIGQSGPEPVALGPLLAGQKVVIFGVPGAFTPTCSSAHVPSFMRCMPRLRDAGVARVICVSVNDPHVMKAWGEASGATAAGIEMLADADGGFTAALGLTFDAPAAGLLNRSQRYAALVEDGVLKVLHREEKRGTCEISGGENMLDAMEELARAG